MSINTTIVVLSDYTLSTLYGLVLIVECLLSEHGFKATFGLVVQLRLAMMIVSLSAFLKLVFVLRNDSHA